MLLKFDLKDKIYTIRMLEGEIFPLNALLLPFYGAE